MFWTYRSNSVNTCVFRGKWPFGTTIKKHIIMSSIGKTWDLEQWLCQCKVGGSRQVHNDRTDHFDFNTIYINLDLISTSNLWYCWFSVAFKKHLLIFLETWMAFFGISTPSPDSCHSQASISSSTLTIMLDNIQWIRIENILLILLNLKIIDGMLA